MILYFCLLLMLMACGEPVIQAEPADPPAEAVVADDGVTRILNDVDAQSASLRDFSPASSLDGLVGKPSGGLVGSSIRPAKERPFDVRRWC